MTFHSFFEAATDEKKKQPYPYQEKLAHQPEPGQPIKSCLIHVPTGCGKTAAAVLAWLWRRKTDTGNTPRRLVYCLPMRVLVEQTREKACEWVSNLKSTIWPEIDVTVNTLMGGEVEEGWELYPEKPAILVGTQDMLLSRALNRGYAMSRYRWPVHFGLFNNDCLW
ncbi:MAG: DEAD/DEAH box helicase, partial [Terriglobia bacterium]